MKKETIKVDGIEIPILKKEEIEEFQKKVDDVEKLVKKQKKPVPEWDGFNLKS